MYPLKLVPLLQSHLGYCYFRGLGPRMYPLKLVPHSRAPLPPHWASVDWQMGDFHYVPNWPNHRQNPKYKWTIRTRWRESYYHYQKKSWILQKIQNLNQNKIKVSSDNVKRVGWTEGLVETDNKFESPILDKKNPSINDEPHYTDDRTGLRQ